MFKKIVLASLLFSSIGFAEGKELLDKVVAVVNEGVITASELDKQVELSKKQIVAQKMQLPEASVLRKQVLQHLIDVDLQMQIAKQNGITIDSTELNEAIERIATMNHVTVTQLREEITRQGFTWSEYRNNIRKEMILTRLQQKAVGKDIAVTNDQVEQYLKKEGTVDNASLTYHLQNIVIPLSEEPTPEEVKKARQDAEKLLVKIKNGDDFSRIAIEESSVK